MDIYRLMKEELKQRQVAKVEEFAPFFICSIGAHLFNLVNIEKKILWQAGQVSDTRVHLLFVANPGYGKTFYISQFLRGQGRLIQPMSMIKHGWLGSLTEAGWVGTIKRVDNEIVVERGAAQQYADGIVGMEEFSAVTDSMKNQYGRLLDTALLTSLDSGYVFKRLGSGEISYRTAVTLWCGAQPMRYDLTSGLGRRFVVMQFIPRKADRELLTKARRRGIGMKFNTTRIYKINAELKVLKERLREVKRVIIEPEVYKLYDKLRILFYLEPLYERLLIGYTIMRNSEVGEELVLKVDSEYERMARQEHEWRMEVSRGPHYSQIIKIIEDNEGKVTFNELRNEMVSYGLSWNQAYDTIYELKRYGVIKVEGEWIKLRRYL